MAEIDGKSDTEREGMEVAFTVRRVVVWLTTGGYR